MVPLFGEGWVYIQYFMGTTCSVRAASPLASIHPCLCGLPYTGCSAGSGNPICKRADGSTTCSVDVSL